MEYIVVTELEIDGEPFNNFSSLTLQQSYRDHHKFIITFKLSDDFFVTSGDVDQFIGKPALIKYKKTVGPQSELAYEFYGYVLEAQFERKGTTYPEFTLIGYSNTIKLEEGASKTFINKSIDKIVDEIIGSKIPYEIRLPDFISEIVLEYTAQYNETSFHYLRALSGWVGCDMHYDGKKLHFGQPGTLLIVDESSNFDLLSIKMNLKIAPQTFNTHAYDAGDDKLMLSKSSGEVQSFGQNASFLQKESNDFFAAPTSTSSQLINISSQKVLDNMVKMTQLARAADLQSISGTSHNPAIAIGRILRVIPPGGNYQSDKAETDYESYLIIKVDHFTEDGNKYINKFEGIPFRESNTFFLEDGVSVLDGKFELIKSYPQVGKVMDNNDPDNKGRIKVQMDWQKDKNETTNWIRVMTPDAGGGKDGAKNRGFVAIPEIGDQVMIDFEWACPDAPFVMGGMFHGKSGGGGGGGNNIKSLTHKSGSHISLVDTRIDMCDAAGNFIQINGTDLIEINALATIQLKVGSSFIEMTTDKITLKAMHIEINGTSDAKMFSGPAELKTQNGGDASVKGTIATVDGNMNTFIKGGVGTHITGTLVEIEATGPATVKGATVKIN